MRLATRSFENTVFACVSSGYFPLCALARIGVFSRIFATLVISADSNREPHRARMVLFRHPDLVVVVDTCTLSELFPFRTRRRDGIKLWASAREHSGWFGFRLMAGSGQWMIRSREHQIGLVDARSRMPYRAIVLTRTQASPQIRVRVDPPCKLMIGAIANPV